MNRKVDMGGLFMEQREEVNIKEILRASRMGMWRVEMDKESHRDFMRMK